LAPIVVAKVGGSLFDLPDLPLRLRSWFAARPEGGIVLVPGGGAAVDEIRRRFACGECSDYEAHWLAVEAMGFHAVRLARALACRAVASFRECRAAPDRWLALDVAPELKADRGRSLPVGWEVTSDSIAAWCSVRLGAAALYLLKSVGGAEPLSVEAAAARGWVDAHFPMVAATAPRLEWVNLRHDPPFSTELTWSSSQGKPAGNSYSRASQTPSREISCTTLPRDRIR
jgi:aspartokinase-like uncharacterized kinase